MGLPLFFLKTFMNLFKVLGPVGSLLAIFILMTCGYCIVMSLIGKVGSSSMENLSNISSLAIANPYKSLYIVIGMITCYGLYGLSANGWSLTRPRFYREMDIMDAATVKIRADPHFDHVVVVKQAERAFKVSASTNHVMGACVWPMCSKQTEVIPWMSRSLSVVQPAPPVETHVDRTYVDLAEVSKSKKKSKGRQVSNSIRSKVHFLVTDACFMSPKHVLVASRQSSVANGAPLFSVEAALGQTILAVQLPIEGKTLPDGAVLMVRTTEQMRAAVFLEYSKSLYLGLASKTRCKTLRQVVLNPRQLLQVGSSLEIMAHRPSSSYYLNKIIVYFYKYPTSGGLAPVVKVEMFDKNAGDIHSDPIAMVPPPAIPAGKDGTYPPGMSGPRPVLSVTHPSARFAFQSEGAFQVEQKYKRDVDRVWILAKGTPHPQFEFGTKRHPKAVSFIQSAQSGLIHAAQPLAIAREGVTVATMDAEGVPTTTPLTDFVVTLPCYAPKYLVRRASAGKPGTPTMWHAHVSLGRDVAAVKIPFVGLLTSTMAVHVAASRPMQVSVSARFCTPKGIYGKVFGVETCSERCLAVRDGVDIHKADTSTLIFKASAMKKFNKYYKTLRIKSFWVYFHGFQLDSTLPEVDVIMSDSSKPGNVKIPHVSADAISGADVAAEASEDPDAKVPGVIDTLQKEAKRDAAKAAKNAPKKGSTAPKVAAPLPPVLPKNTSGYKQRNDKVIRVHIKNQKSAARSNGPGSITAFLILVVAFFLI